MSAQDPLPNLEDPTTDLEAAKERLRKSLVRLEELVERRVSESGQSDGLGDELEQQLQAAANENAELKQANARLSEVQQQVSSRVDAIMATIKDVVEQ